MSSGGVGVCDVTDDVTGRTSGRRCSADSRGDASGAATRSSRMRTQTQRERRQSAHRSFRRLTVAVDMIGVARGVGRDGSGRVQWRHILTRSWKQNRCASEINGAARLQAFFVSLQRNGVTSGPQTPSEPASQRPLPATPCRSTTGGGTSGSYFEGGASVLIFKRECPWHCVAR